MLKNKIKKVRLDGDEKNQASLEKIPLERLIETYIEMSVEVIKEMEKRRDPVFLEVLQYTQAHLTREEFLSIQIEIYAACNKIAMQQCTHITMSSESDQSGYESSSSYEIVVPPTKKKLPNKEGENKGKSTEDEKDKEDVKGRVDEAKPTSSVKERRKMLKRRKLAKRQVWQNVYKHLQKPHVRAAYEDFSREIDPKHDLNSDKTRKTVRVSADENFLSVTIIRRSPLPY